MADFDIDVIRNKGTDDEYSTCPLVCEFPDFLAHEVVDASYDDELVQPYTIVITHDEITISFDYPLSNPTRMTFTNPGGFTRFDFFRCVYEGYKKIYEQEEAADGDPGMIPGMLNRASNNGPHGIWGHVMEDLYLEGVYDEGDGNYRLAIGS